MTSSTDSSCNCSRGFALFEVLISASILAVAAVLICQSLTSSARAIRKAQESYQESLRRENLLWQENRLGLPDHASPE